MSKINYVFVILPGLLLITRELRLDIATATRTAASTVY